MEAGRCRRLSPTPYTGSGGRARAIGASRVIRRWWPGAGARRWRSGRPTGRRAQGPGLRRSATRRVPVLPSAPWLLRSGWTSRGARCRRIPARGPGAAGKWRCASGASASSTSSTSAGRRVNQDNDRLRAERDELLAAFRHVADVNRTATVIARLGTRLVGTDNERLWRGQCHSSQRST